MLIQLRNKLKIEGLVPIKLRQATFKEEVTMGTHKLTSTGKIIVEQTKLETITHKKCASYSKTQYISNYEICCVQPDYSQFTKLVNIKTALLLYIIPSKLFKSESVKMY